MKMAKCNPHCAFTASHDGMGRRIMISMPGNSKFSIPHTVHPQCESCASDEMEEARLAVLFKNDRALIEKYKKMKGKL